MQRHLAAVLTIGAFAWVAALLVAPLALHSHLPAFATTSAIFYESAGLICHQRPERSFALAGEQLPVCARCSGLYFSGALGAAAAWLARPRQSGAASARFALGIAALPTVITFSLEQLGAWAPSNTVRAVAALPLGAAAAWFMVSSLRAEAVRYHS